MSSKELKICIPEKNKHLETTYGICSECEHEVCIKCDYAKSGKHYSCYMVETEYDNSGV